MDTSVSVQGTTVSKKRSSRISNFFSQKGVLKKLKVVLPVAALAFFFPEIATAAAGGKDLMASGDDTVGKTFGSESSIVKWVVLAEVIVGGIMYMTTKNIKFLAGFAILSVFLAVGMSVAGY
ncbi:type IV conjugative transfer system pilin TraA [Xenorhabdus sp. XENO-1]|uniref:type IV conjugative transfer system pilin TraA n=1 Tax=Xenorhabdus bovienii TaxID=40576 RepID=UPI0020CA83A9|nr:type IV conjugative transfer system pilin TraA [Xenorhabdus bovienii]MCP9269138.1 type IV conjugative transfer system pilin TraA [Xenorhabdus bovienii subsp. africana]